MADEKALQIAITNREEQDFTVRFEMSDNATRADVERSRSASEVARWNAENARHTHRGPAEEERKRDTIKTGIVGLVVLSIVAIGSATLDKKDLLTFYLSCTGILAVAWGASEALKSKKKSSLATAQKPEETVLAK